LARPLRDGMALPAALRVQRVVSARGATALAAARDPAAQAAVLRALAAGQDDPTPGYWLVWGLPLWLTVAAVVPGMALRIFLQATGIGQMIDGYSGHWSLPAGEIAIDLLGPLALVGALVAIAQLPGMRPMQALWGTEVLPRALMARLIARGALDDGAAEAVADRRMGWLRGWREDWRLWSAVAAWRVPEEERRRAAALASARERCLAMGWVPTVPGATDSPARPDWPAAEQAAREAYREAMALDRPALLIGLGIAAVGGLKVLVFSGNLLQPWDMSPAHGAPVPPIAVLLLFAAGSGMLAIGAWQGLLLARRVLFQRSPGPRLGALVANRVAGAMRAGGDVVAALRSVQALAHPPFPKRIRAAVYRLESGEGGVVEVLVRCRVLPASWRASGMAAETLGPAAFARWAGEMTVGGLSMRARTVLLSQLPLILVAIVIFVFICVGILPRMLMTFTEEEIPVTPAFLRLLALTHFLGHWWYVAPFIALLWLRLPDISRWFGARRALRRAHGALLLSGVALGLSEAELAERLAVGEDRPSAEACAAGDRGDFAGLCRACGWRAATPAGLAAAIQVARARAERWRAWWSLAIEVGHPLVLGVPVGFLVVTIYGMLLSVADAIEHWPAP
jgi:hypothetical protein